MDTSRSHSRAPPLFTLGITLGITLLALRLLDRIYWCACGQPNLWWSDTASSHNSQHLFDPYSLTHVLHGLLFYGALVWFLPRLGPLWQLCLAVAVESMWEIFENTSFVIERYRAATVSLDYYGDSIANSGGDILSCILGFGLARRLGLRPSVALFIATEILLLVWIRDSLLLNVVMLIWPLGAIRDWQLGG